MNYNVGIVGCGRIFPMHAVPVSDRKDTNIAAVCDIKEDKAKEKAKEFNCSWYTDYETMIQKEDLDTVHVCTPHHLHAPITILAAENGINILTEKPMSIKEKNAVQMIETAEENDVTLGVIFQNRYNPGSLAVKNNLDNGALGEIKAGKLFLTWQRTDEYYSESDWKGTWEKEGGGVIIDQAIHTMDLMRWFMDDEVKSVEASIATRYHDLIEVEDMAEGIIEFNSGVMASFYTMNFYSYDAPIEVELDCENGQARLKNDTAEIEFNNGRKIIATRNPKESFNYGDVESYWGVSHIKQINNYYDALKNDEQPDITGKKAFKTQQMICAIYESGKTDKKVKINNK